MLCTDALCTKSGWAPYWCAPPTKFSILTSHAVQAGHFAAEPRCMILQHKEHTGWCSMTCCVQLPWPQFLDTLQHTGFASRGLAAGRGGATHQRNNEWGNRERDRGPRRPPTLLLAGMLRQQIMLLGRHATTDSCAQVDKLQAEAHAQEKP